MGMFTLLLDGLLDEAPSDLAIASTWLRNAMNPQNWGGAGLEEFRCPTLPVTDALCWLTKSIVDTVTTSAGWADAIVREQLRVGHRRRVCCRVEQRRARNNERRSPTR